MPSKTDEVRSRDRKVAMTAKHYRIIAEVFREFFQSQVGHEYSDREIVSYFAAHLGETNPAFDRDRFMKACGFIC